MPQVSGCSTHAATLEEARTRVRQLLAMFFPNADGIEVEEDYGDSLSSIPQDATECPACRRSGVIAEKRVLRRVVKYCPNCGIRWSEDDSDLPDG